MCLNHAYCNDFNYQFNLLQLKNFVICLNDAIDLIFNLI